VVWALSLLSKLLINARWKFSAQKAILPVVGSWFNQKKIATFKEFKIIIFLCMFAADHPFTVWRNQQRLCAFLLALCCRNERMTCYSPAARTLATRSVTAFSCVTIDTLFRFIAEASLTLPGLPVKRTYAFIQCETWRGSSQLQGLWEINRVGWTVGSTLMKSPLHSFRSLRILLVYRHRPRSPVELDWKVWCSNSRVISLYASNNCIAFRNFDELVKFKNWCHKHH